MKKVVIGILAIILLALCAVGGTIVYVPSPDEDYPQDYSVKDYKNNIHKNRDLIVEKLEEINEPTLKETMKKYANESKTLNLFPTALDTIEQSEMLFLEKDKFPVLKNWRLKRFMQKNYSNAYEYQRQFEKAAHEAVESGEYSEEFSAKPYTYKDGSMIHFNAGGMSIEYAD